MSVLGASSPAPHTSVLPVVVLSRLRHFCGRRFITLTDVRRSGMGPLFFSAMTNVHKLLAGELADAAAARLAQTTRLLPGWDRWAADFSF